VFYGHSVIGTPRNNTEFKQLPHSREMKRSFPHRSTLSKTVPEPKYATKPGVNFCPIPPKTNNSNSNSGIVEPNEHEKLIIRYRELVNELKVVRGKLYTKGIDPEKYM
jgi:hypothetical protein